MMQNTEEEWKKELCDYINRDNVHIMDMTYLIPDQRNVAWKDYEHNGEQKPKFYPITKIHIELIDMGL